jgi:hypothetical protein
LKPWSSHTEASFYSANKAGNGVAYGPCKAQETFLGPLLVMITALNRRDDLGHVMAAL